LVGSKSDREGRGQAGDGDQIHHYLQ